MKMKNYKIVGDIGSYPDGPDGEKYEKLDIEIISTETDALIIRDAIQGGYDGHVNVFEKESGETVICKMEEELNKLLESDMNVEEIADLLESKMSLEEITKLLKLG